MVYVQPIKEQLEQKTDHVASAEVKGAARSALQQLGSPCLGWITALPHFLLVLELRWAPEVSQHVQGVWRSGGGVSAD